MMQKKRMKTMNNEPFYKIMINTEKDTIFIQLKDERYKDVLAKVGHIQYDENNEIEFDMELPQGFEKYYDDNVFTNYIQNAVYDIVATSVQSYWKEAEMVVLKTIEERLVELFKSFNIETNGKAYLELFAEKGYAVMENVDDNNRLMAIKTNDDKQYYFDNKEDFAFLKSEIGGSGLII